MAEERWHEARLIPVSGINGAEEQERRATSALLAVMTAVREYVRALTMPLGAPAGTLEAYIEVPFLLGEARYYPDGLVRVRRGARTWTALIEVKTGDNLLEAQQLENYLDIAREQGFDALLTISNEIAATPAGHPTSLDKRKVKKVALHHYSWSEVLAAAVVQKEHRGVADPDQSWVLGELIRYLEHPRSGALEFDDMGPSWVSVRQAITAGTLRPSDKGAAEVAARFDALMRYASLRLGRRLGTEVIPALTRKELADPNLRSQSLLASLATSGTLNAAIRIPNAIAPLLISVDLRAGLVSCEIEIDAPKDGRPATRVNWLVRQLQFAPETLRLEAFLMHARGTGAAALLGAVRDNPALLIADPKKDLRAFRIAMTVPMGSKRGRGRGGFIDSVLEVIDSFYGDAVQHLKAWTAAPPRLREPADTPTGTPVALISTALSSQDGAENGVVSSADGQEMTASTLADEQADPERLS